MYKSIIVATLLVIACFSSNLSAEIIYQSGTLGQTGIPWQTLLDDETISGAGVEPSVFVGVRFEVDKRVLVTGIGGHFIGHPLNHSNAFLGGIYQLENETDFPDSNNFTTSDVLVTFSLTFPEPSDVVFGELSAELEPSWYAILFGSGIFGTTAVGAAMLNGQDDGLQAYIGWQPGFGWSDLSSLFDNHYFIVEGTIIPEPTTIVLLGTCGVVILLKRRKTG